MLNYRLLLLPNDRLIRFLTTSALGVIFACQIDVTANAQSLDNVDDQTENPSTDDRSFTPIVDEIFVTAQKRSQSLQDVPIAVNAITGTNVRKLRLSAAQDIAKQIPNLEIKNTLGGSNPVIAIRGISLNDFSANNSQSAGVYVDDVFFVSTAMMGFQLFDLDRVEVLKGPQGTLYGRNTTAGAVKFITRKPSTNEGNNYLQAGYGRYQTLELEGGVGLSLADNLNGRISFQAVDRSKGYVTNTFTGNNNYGKIEKFAARGLLDWKVNDNVSVLLNVHGGDDNSDSLANWKARGTNCSEFAATGLSGPTCSDFFGYVDPDFDDPFTGAWGFDPKLNLSNLGGSVTVEYALDNFTISSITAAEKVDRLLTEDADGSPLVGFDIRYDNEIEQVSQELRFTSTGLENANIVAGLFYSKDIVNSQPGHGVESHDAFGLELSLFYKQKTEAIAGFAHTEWNLSDNLNFTAGLRYTHEQKDYNGVVQGILADGTNIGVLDLGFGNIQNDSEFEDSNVSGKLGLDYKPHDSTLFYASISRGFKSGGFPGTVVLSPQELASYDSETLTAYEVGMKTTLLDGALRWNSAAFYYDYKDLQLFTQDPANGFIRLTNADKAKVTGFDSDITWQLSENVQLVGGIGYIDTENQDPLFDGRKLPNAPEFSFNGSFEYTTPISDSLDLSALLSLSHVGRMFKGTENLPSTESPAYTLVNARTALEVNDEWELAIWANNIFDKRYIVEIFDQSDLLGNTIFNWGAPADYGVTVSYRW